ncbi:MAG: DUF1015 family protein [Actinomycetota bacterium]
MTSEMGRPDERARPLRLAPFRAVRYNPSRVADLGAVTCPPYDVIGGDHVGEWEAADPHNVVRLILPRNGHGDGRYANAAADLQAWLAEGVLIRDESPALYVYEQSSDEGAALGLIGAVSLHEPAEGRIVPHEDVFPGPVADRTALMSATRAQFEPILLTYEGNGAASDAIDRAVAATPLVEMTTTDGATHRLWRLTDPRLHRTVAADLAERQLLIADGHHRYAAYLALRSRGDPSPEAPRAYGLAMVVDAARHPLRLAAIHRSVADLSLDDAADAAGRAFRTVGFREVEGDLDAVVHMLDDSPSSHRFVLSDGRSVALLSDPHPDAVRASMPADRSPLWQSLDASIAQRLLLSTLWKLDDDDMRIAYHHRAIDALERAARSSGVAVLLAPARHSDVLALAARGERLPHKSTSFGPKPRTGLLMRLLDDEGTISEGSQAADTASGPA